jgi:hypothetical protein
MTPHWKRCLAKEWLTLVIGLFAGLLVPLLVRAAVGVFIYIPSTVGRDYREFLGMLFASRGVDRRFAWAVVLGPYVMYQFWRSIIWAVKTFRGERAVNATLAGPEPDVKGEIEQSGDKFSGATVVSEEASASGEERTKQELPINWLNFYVGVRIPLGIGIAVIRGIAASYAALRGVGAFAASAAPEVRAFGLSTLITAPFEVCVAICLFVGLRRRRLWGWWLNWFVLVLETLGRPLDMADNVTMYPVFLIAVALLWFLPNAIYFKKRRCLFT